MLPPVPRQPPKPTMPATALRPVVGTVVATGVVGAAVVGASVVVVVTGAAEVGTAVVCVVVVLVEAGDGAAMVCADCDGASAYTLRWPPDSERCASGACPHTRTCTDPPVNMRHACMPSGLHYWRLARGART